MKFKFLIKAYIIILLVSGFIYFLVSSSQIKNKHWKESYSRPYFESMSDKNFKRFVDDHRHVAGLGYIEVKGEKLERRIENPSNMTMLFTKKSIEKIILVIIATGIFILVYYIIRSMIIFVKRYSHTKDTLGTNNLDDRQFKGNQSLEQRYLSIFGLNEKFSENEIKKKYRELISQYHPDKVQHLGREFQQMAEEKTKEIQKAYNYFKQNYNINN